MQATDKKEYQELLELMTVLKSPDKDNRFMASSDLMKRFKSDIEGKKTVDGAIEKQMCQAFIKHLEDISMDVKTQAINSLEKVVPLVQDDNLDYIAEGLVGKILDPKMKEEERDIYLSAIQGSIKELNDANATKLIKKINPQLVTGLGSQSGNAVEKCLEIMGGLYQKFHILLFRNESLIKKAEVTKKLCGLQSATDDKLNKKIADTMGYFSMCLNAADLNTLLKNQISRLAMAKNSKQVVLSSLEAISAIAQFSGAKLASQFEQLFKLIKVYPDGLSKDASDDTQNEIVQTALETIKNLLLKCSTQAQDHLDEIFESAKHCLRYDPEFNYDTAEESMQNQEDDDEGWGDDGDGWDDEEVEQADDSSAWKVRKGAIKIINAMIQSCPGQLKEYWKRYLLLLTERLKERDINVKVKIMDAMQNLAKASISIDEKNNRRSTFSVKIVKMRSYVDDVKKDFTKIVEALVKEGGNSDQAVRIEVMKTFSVLFKLMPNDEGEEELTKVLDMILDGKKGDKDSYNYNLYSLEILKQTFKNVEGDEQSMTAQEHSEKLFNYLKSLIAHQNVKIQSEAIRVMGFFIMQQTELGGEIDDSKVSLVKPCYDTLMVNLEKNDNDLDVRFNSIISMGFLIKSCHSKLQQPQINKVMEIYQKRVSVEGTREATLRAYVKIANNDSIVKLSSLDNLVPELINQLHQNSRSVQILALQAIQALMIRYGDQFKSNANQLQGELAKLVSEEDHQRTALAVQNAIILLPSASAERNNQVVQACIKFAKNDNDPVAVSVKAIQDFLALCANKGIIGQASIGDFKAMAALNHRAAAKFAAAIVHSKAMTNVVNDLNAAIKKVPKDVAESNEDGYIQSILLYGECGALMDQSGAAGVVDSIHELFKNNNSKVRQAGAIALGDITIGNTGFFLDKVFQQMQSATQSQEKQMFLITLREIIINNPKCLNQQQLDKLMEQYLVQSQTKDQIIRNIIAESIGKLYICHEFRLQAPILKALKGDGNQVATFALSFRFSAYNNSNKVAFQPYIEDLVNLISHPDLDAKVGVLKALQQIAGNENLKSLFSNKQKDMMVTKTVAETPQKKELITTVDLGAFKDVRDAGVPVRKEAFNLLEVLSNHFFFDFTPVCNCFTVHGMVDTDENIQVQSFNQIKKIQEKQEIAVVNCVDALVTSFELVYKKTKINIKPGNETERALNLTRAMFKLVLALSKNDEIKQNEKFAAFFTLVSQGTDGVHVKELFESLN